MSSHHRPLLWGVLNVTPDSFSDGGEFLDLDDALVRAHRMVEEGADVIDVGGESTRPGAIRISPEEESARVLPVVTALVKAGIPVSIDTMNAHTARAAAEAGVTYINDVSGGLADPAMLGVMHSAKVDCVLMHWRGHSQVMDSLAHYENVAEDVARELAARVEAATAAGIEPERIILDPGIGFSKTPEQNWELLAHFDAVRALGHRILLGVSRKRFLGELLSEGKPASARDTASATLGALMANRGVWGLRVHNPGAQRESLDVWQALSQGGR